MWILKEFRLSLHRGLKFVIEMSRWLFLLFIDLPLQAWSLLHILKSFSEDIFSEGTIVKQGLDTTGSRVCETDKLTLFKYEYI